jgi:hypothetical protein
MIGVDSPTIPNVIATSADSETPGRADNAPPNTEEGGAKRTDDNEQQPKDSRGSWWEPAVFSP